MKKQVFFRFWLIFCIIALTVSFASCDETVTPAETTVNITETVEITNEPETTIVPETTSVPETTKVPETTSAPETTEAPHVHAWSSWVTVLEATCTTKGNQERTCSCGKKEYQFIDALVHNFGDWKTTTAATCTVKGRQERTCACGRKEYQSIDSLGHNYGEWTVTKTATCTAKGRQERTCSTCSKKENQTIAALGHTEGKWIIDKVPTCQSAGSQHTECTVCNKKVQTQAIEANLTHKYDGNFCSICGKKSPDFEFPSGYITTKPIEIETEYCILKIDQNVYVVDGVAEKVDIVCRALEEVTGLKFKNDTYGKDKVVINVTHGEEPWGITGKSEIAFKEFTIDFTREVTIAPRSLFISSSRALVHELAHALHFSQTKWRQSKIFIEGFATYVTQLTMQYLAEHHPYIQHTMVPVDYEIQCMVIYTEELYKEKIEYWFEHPFTHTPHYHVNDEYYTIGFRIMWYLHDTYGDFTQWILFRESIDPASNYYNEKHNGYWDIDISNEDWFTEIKQIYGADVLDNFYPWLKANESLFEFDLMSREAYDLTSIEYTTMYPMFDNIDDFTETGKITFDNLYIDIEEAKKYLTEYKGKFIQYMRFATLDGVKVHITYYDKNGNVLYESNSTSAWVGEEVSYIKLNGQGTVRNLEIIGYADYLENGLAYHDVYPTALSTRTAYTELRCIYDFEGTHIIIPSEVNGLPVKVIRNLYNGKLNQVIEFTVSEGIEEMFLNVFRYLPNVKKINLPSSLNKINNWWFGVKTIEIYYAGTKSDWEAIQKDADWDKNLTSYTLHCTDGDIVKGNG